MVTKTRPVRQRGVQQARAALPKVSEKVFQGQVEHYLRLMGWLVFHPYLSIKSTPGYPDITAVRAGRVAFCELKTVDGKLSPAQILWGEALAAVGGTVEYHVLRPTDWAYIEQMFR
jgi:hypothetical protein